MRSDAKPPTAGSNQRRARGLGCLGIGALLAFLALLTAAPALASQRIVNFIGDSQPGELGGQLTTPVDVAVNSSGAGPADPGDVYVADFNNHRVQRFSAAGEFTSAWGANVVHRDEVQTIRVVATGGTYKLTFDGSTTAPIAFNASVTTVDNALDVLPSIGGDANVVVSGFAPEYTVTFKGTLAGIDVPLMKADIAELSGGANRNVHIATTEGGSGGGGSDYEICTEADKCSAAVASGGNGTAAGNGTLNQPKSIAVDGDTGDVYVADHVNRRINVYDGGGDFIRSFGWDVAASGPGNTGAAYEICEDSDGDVCKAGVAGSGVGQYGSGTASGSNFEIYGIAVSPADGEASTGTVFLADSGNRRVGTYGLDGGSPSFFGSATQFDSLQPRKIAVDSRGIVYASNSKERGRIDRYDTEDANGAGVGFLEPISAAANDAQLIDLPEFADGKHLVLTCPDGTKTEPVEYESGINGTVARQIVLNELETFCGSPGDFIVTGNGIDAEVTFVGSLAATDLNQMECEFVEGGTCTVTTVINGAPGTLLAPPTTNAATTTRGIAVDPDDDTLFVLRSSKGPTVVQQFGPVNPAGLLAAPTETDDFHGSFVTGSNNLGLDDASGNLYVVDISTNVAVLAEPDSVPTPSAEIDPVSVKDDSSATFSGAVDPQGALIECQFEYSTDQQQWFEVAVPACDSLALDGGTQPIETEVTGLDPGTHYFVRLAIARPFIPGTTVTTASVSFKTDAAPPTVTDVGAVQVADTSARLVGTINPRNSATGYRFEYGTTPALGSTTAPLAVGAGTDPITVSRVVGGLTPSMTYHFRLVATNATGTTTSQSQKLTTRATPFAAAASRRWEQVSPPEKNYSDVDAGIGRNTFSVAPGGESVVFCPTGALFGEPTGQQSALCTPYMSRRTSTGWRTGLPYPPHCHVDPVAGTIEGVAGVYPSPDHSRVMVKKTESEGCGIPPLDPAAPLASEHPSGELLPFSHNLYLKSATTDSADPDNYQLLNPQDGGEFFGQNFVGGSDDFSHLIYQSKHNQTSEPDSPAPGNFRKLYEWDEDADALRLVTRNTSNEAFTTPSLAPAIASVFGAAVPLASAVSDDGERIYFANPAPSGETVISTCVTAGCQIYMREGGAVTLDVSASECTVDCGSPQTKADYFLSATPSGERAFFTSCAKLSDDSAPQGACTGPFAGIGANGSHLYRWDRNVPAGGRLVDLTADKEPIDGVQPNFRGLIGHSDDGETAYFVAGGQIVAGEPTEAGEKIYRWRWNAGSPVVDYLGSYENACGGACNSGGIDNNWMQMRRQVTPDGEHLLVYTELAYSPGDRDEDVDAYRWDEQNGWICVSCQLPGAPSAGDVALTEMWLGYDSSFQPIAVGIEPRIYMSDDGRSIFFDTPDALVPADVNGELACPVAIPAGVGGQEEVRACTDVYEWRDGTVSLVSSGIDGAPSRLIASTPSGRDVFFVTRERLVGWDKDNNSDIYDARLGGGFPEPAPQPAECEGEGCRDEGTDAPEVVGAGTAVFQGAGNPKTEAGGNPCPANRLRRGKRCLTLRAVARKRCRRLNGVAKRRCVRKQTRRLRRAQRRRAQRAKRLAARGANFNRRAGR